MKKLLVVLLISLMVFMGGCESTPQVPSYSQEQVDALLLDLELQFEDYYTQDELNILLDNLEDNLLDEVVDLQAQLNLVNSRLDGIDLTIDELEEILINLGVIEGLNGQQEFYLPSHTSMPSAMSFQLLGEELDKVKAPSYVLDENEDYIPFDDVVNKLALKYYGEYILNDAFLNFRVGFSIDTPTLDKEEFIARSILLIEELSNYDFYIIGSSYVYIQVNCYGATSTITVPTQTLRSSFITLNAEVMIAGLYEVEYFQLNFNAIEVQSLYDAYVLDGTFDGYVLNFN